MTTDIVESSKIIKQIFRYMKIKNKLGSNFSSSRKLTIGKLTIGLSVATNKRRNKLAKINPVCAYLKIILLKPVHFFRT